jgi:EGF domain-containing protein
MKNTKAVLLMAFIVTSLFTAVIFTSCTKKSCSNVICQNGGTCSGGTCTCPSGYYGTFCEAPITTYIRYKNNTFTPVTIVVGGVTAIIPKGGSYTVTGKYRTTATGTATTSGAASSLGISAGGGVIGLPINWDINNDFPAKDTLVQPLDVGATYFFLRMNNSGAKNIIDYYVNVQFSYGQVYEDVTVPNDHNTYDLGYYLAYPGSNVQTQSSNSTIVWTAVTLQFTSNQTYTAMIH